MIISKEITFIWASILLCAGCGESVSVDDGKAISSIVMEPYNPTELYGFFRENSHYVCPYDIEGGGALVFFDQESQGALSFMRMEDVRIVDEEEFAREVRSCSPLSRPESNIETHVTILGPQGRRRLTPREYAELDESIALFITRSGLMVDYYISQNSVFCFEHSMKMEIPQHLEGVNINIPTFLKFYQVKGTCRSVARSLFAEELPRRTDAAS